jgi:uncharacterized phiE125 gp8 family phage protein
VANQEYGLTLVTAPASEPVSLAVAKAHLRIDHDDEDALIASWIRAARQATESYTGRRWIEQDVRLTLAGFPRCGSGQIRLPVQPVSEITGFTYLDADGAEQTLADGTGYQTWLDHNPPLVAPPVNGYWPQTQTGAIQAVTIAFTAGGDAGDVPEQVVAAILLTIGDWDKNRAGEGDPIGRGLPPAAKWQLDQLWTGAYS